MLQQLEGKVWEWIIPSSELAALKQEHIVSGTIRRSDGVQVRVVSERRPTADAIGRAPNLEDAYLYLIGGRQ
jgi:hypothetical protein